MAFTDRLHITATVQKTRGQSRGAMHGLPMRRFYRERTHRKSFPLMKSLRQNWNVCAYHALRLQDWICRMPM